MANARGHVYLKLLGLWLLIGVVRVRVDTGPSLQHHENLPHSARGSTLPTDPGEMRFSLLMFFASKEFSGLLLAEPAMRVQRRRGGRRAASGEHHFHSPSTSQPPSHCSRSGSKRAPSVISPGALLSHSLSAREIFTVVKGAGVYLALIYLQTIEKNPGPDEGFSKKQQEFLNTMKDDITQSVAEALVEFTRRIEKNEKDVKELREENTSLHQRIAHLERHARRNNVVIYGIPDNIQPAAALQKITTTLGLGNVPQTECVYRIGRQTEKRPLLVRFCSQRDKQSIMDNVRKLKGTRIVVSDDLTPDEQATRRTILSAARAAKEKGIESKVRRTGLLVHNRLVPVVELSDETWMDKLPPRAGAAGAAGAQPPKRTHAVIATPPESQPSTSEDFWGAPPGKKKDKTSKQPQGAPRERSSSRNRLNK
jgi:hypothetical protein